MAQDLKRCAIQICNTEGIVCGTGFIIDFDATTNTTTAVTCAHVAEAAGAGPGGSVTIASAPIGDTRSAKVLTDAWRPADGDDIAILRWQGELPPEIIPAIPGPSDATTDHLFRAFGYPEVGDMQGVWAKGDIIGPITDSNQRRILQLCAQEIAPGMSGAPVLDTNCDRVVGMVTATYCPPEGSPKLRDLAFATPLETVAEVWPVELIRPRLPFRLATPLALILIGLLLVITLMPSLFEAIQGARQPMGWLHAVWPAPTFTPTPLPPMSNSGFNIAVAQFTMSDNAAEPAVTQESRSLSAWLFKAIDQEARHFQESSLHSLSFEVQGPDQIGPIMGRDSATQDDNAARIARQQNAALLIYGVVTAGSDGYYVQPKFYVSEQGFGYGSEVAGPSRLGQPVPFAPPLGDPGTLLGVNKRLDARVKALRYLVSGLASYYVNLYDEAYGKFEQAALVPDWQPAEGKEVVYLLMGAAKLRIYDDPKVDLDRRTQALVQASQAFTKAYQLNPDYARSYLGLGAVALQQATTFDPEWTGIVNVDNAKLIEAEMWYSNSLRASDQPISACVRIKAAYGLGQVHLVGNEFGYPGWSKEEARTFLNQVVDAYDPENSPELTWFVGDAHALLARLEGRDGDWAAMSSECRQAIDVLNNVPFGSARCTATIANDWACVAWAEERSNRLDEARAAYRHAIQLGQDYIAPKKLEEWRVALDCLEKGSTCHEP